MAIKVFDRAAAVRVASCLLPEDPDDDARCVTEEASVCGLTSREARLQEIVATRLAHDARAAHLHEPCVIPEVLHFAESPRQCFLEMQRLFPPPAKKRNLIQLHTAESSYDQKGTQGHYLGAAEVERYLAEFAPSWSLDRLLHGLGFVYASLHFSSQVDGFDVEFVLAATSKGGPARLCALDFDKVSYVKAGPPSVFPYCVCRKIAENDFTPHRISGYGKLYRFLASAVNSSGTVPPSGPLWESFAKSYASYGAAFRRPPWPPDSASGVLQALQELHG